MICVNWICRVVTQPPVNLEISGHCMGGRGDRLQRRNLEILPWHAGTVLGKSKFTFRLECQGQGKSTTTGVV